MSEKYIRKKIGRYTYRIYKNSETVGTVEKYPDAWEALSTQGDFKKCKTLTEGVNFLKSVSK